MAGEQESILHLGVAGLGRAFSVMLPTLAQHPRVKLVAAADLRTDALARFAREFSARCYGSVEALCSDPAVQAVYVATPHQYHSEHAMLAARHGKHLLIEKPMALTVAECHSIIETARHFGVQIVVGHSHSFDGPVQRVRALIENGEFGQVCMINALNYTDYLYRPRRPEELDTASGGGAIFNQAAHQVDIVRLIAGAPVASVRAMTGAWDRERPTEGAYACVLTFTTGVFASLVYGGYGHFDSDEFEGWIGEMGQKKQGYAGVPPPAFKSRTDEIAFKNDRNYGGSQFSLPSSFPAAHQHFGTLLVSCERADLRPVPTGVMVYQRGTATLDPLPPPRIPRGAVIDELYDAAVNGKTAFHDGAWGMATLEVLLAMLQSARSGLEVRLANRPLR